MALTGRIVPAAGGQAPDLKPANFKLPASSSVAPAPMQEQPVAREAAAVAPPPAPTPAAPVAAAPPAAAAPSPAPAGGPAAAAPSPPAEATPPAAPTPGTPAPGTPAAGDAAPAGGEESPDAWRFATLAKQRRELREQQDALKKQQAELQQQVAQLPTLAQQQAAMLLQQRAQAYRQNPTLFVQDFGLDYYNQLSQVIAQGGLSPEQLARQELVATQQAVVATQQRLSAFEQRQAEEARKQQEASERAQKEAETAAEQEAVNEFKGELAGFAKTEGEKYELINLEGQAAVDRMYAIVDDHFAKTGQKLSPQQVADMVEGELLERETKKIKASKKLGGLVAPAAPPPPRPGTLTNRFAPAPTLKPAAGGESEYEKRQRVLAEINKSMGRR